MYIIYRIFHSSIRLRSASAQQRFILFQRHIYIFFLPVESGDLALCDFWYAGALEKHLLTYLLLVWFLGMFFASTMIMVSIALVMAVIVTNIYAKKDTPQRCPKWTVRLASRFYPAHYLPGHSVHTGPHSDRHGHTYTSRAPPSRGRQVPTTLETFDFRRSEAEWRMVAKFTDRVFFWLFFFMSLCVQANLFLQMIPETRHAVIGVEAEEGGEEQSPSNM